MSKVKKRTYRVKKGFGSHQIILEGKRETFEPGGKTFQAYPYQIEGWEFKLEEISSAGDVVAVEEKKEEYENEEVEDKATSLELEHLGGGYYDVINKASGKKINSKALRKKDAEALLLNDEEIDDEDEEVPVKKKRSKIA